MCFWVINNPVVHVSGLYLYQNNGLFCASPVTNAKVGNLVEILQMYLFAKMYP